MIINFYYSYDFMSLKSYLKLGKDEKTLGSIKFNKAKLKNKNSRVLLCYFILEYRLKVTLGCILVFLVKWEFWHFDFWVCEPRQQRYIETV
jgi:hypothetical protein